ncbi:MAG TPA: DUF6029 family protein [Bacteroidales bacterium]|nr:DUF6029 family protein [Bacteroidales bacterium]
MKKITILFLGLFGLGIFSVCAQENNYGQINGNFQSEVQYYIEDKKIGASAVDEKLLANSWANFTYTLGKFSAGFRYEGYMNSLLGYPNTGGRNDGIGIPYKWAMFSTDNLEITVGNFYEQFGNGIVLRSYEEKMLGVDNALNGFRIKYNPVAGIYMKGLIGKQRFYWELGPGTVRGFDTEIQFNELFQSFSESSLRFSLGGSFVSKYQKEENPIYYLPSNVGTGAGRVNISYKGFAVLSEYAYKINDPSADNNFIFKPGQAFLVNATYSQKGLGIILGTKWVDNMSFRSDRNSSLTDLNINLLPEITRNHIYTLPAFYPYASQPNGEWGAKAEIMYKIKKGSKLGGKYGTTVSINYSRVHEIEKTQINDTIPISAAGTLGYNTSFFSIGDEVYFQDINIEISKKWNKKIYTNLSYVNLLYNYNILRGVSGHDDVLASIAIADMTYKFTDVVALKTEFQGMFTKQDDGNWGLGLVELSIPNWFFTVFDNWNYGNPDPETRPHYLNVGFGYVHGGSRIQLTYGKQRAGVMCIGGVCRNVPASNGISLSISSTF